MTTNTELLNIMDKSDKTILRCLENGIPVPHEWKQYRAELRIFITNKGGVMPTRPPYPEGT